MRLVSSGCLTVYPLGRWSSVIGLGLSYGWNFSTISAAATARNPRRCKGSASFRYTDVIAYQSADSHLPGRQDYVTAKPTLAFSAITRALACPRLSRSTRISTCGRGRQGPEFSERSGGVAAGLGAIHQHVVPTGIRCVE